MAKQRLKEQLTEAQWRLEAIQALVAKVEEQPITAEQPITSVEVIVCWLKAILAEDANGFEIAKNFEKTFGR